MEEKVYLTTKAQVDLLTDPLCLAVINLLGKQLVTEEWIAEQLEEEQDFIGKCVRELADEGLLVRVEEDGEVKYGRRAKSLEVDQSLLNDADEYWVSGILNHVENEVSEVLQISKGADRQNFFDQLGYQDMTISASSLRLTKEEVEEFHQMVASFIARHSDDDETNELKKYGLAVVVYPDVPNIKQAIREKKNK